MGAQVPRESGGWDKIQDRGALLWVFGARKEVSKPDPFSSSSYMLRGWGPVHAHLCLLTLKGYV